MEQTEQEKTILACTHPEQGGEVKLSGGRRVNCCTECWTRSVAVRRAGDKARLEADRERGRQYWAARGVQVGARVSCFARSWTGLGGSVFSGIAKVGKGGAYVSSKCQRGKLAPDGWRIAKEG